MGIYSLANSSINNWIKYSNAAAANGQTSDFELITTQTLTSAQASVTFGNLGTLAIPYKHLQLRASIRTDRGSVGDFVQLKFNGDSTAGNYSQHGLEGNGAVSSYGSVNNGQITISYAATSGDVASVFSGSVTDILNFQSSSANKTTRSLSGMYAAGINISLRSGAWFSTNPVTSITLTSFYGANFSSGSRFSLYGVK